MTTKESGLTPLGKFFSTILILALIGIGVFVILKKPAPAPSPADEPGTANPSEPIEVAETLQAVPALAPASPYRPQDGVVDIELSEYAGYAGLIAANRGLEPNEDSVFFKKHGFKVRIRLSEEESWSSLNAGKMAASATTVDVLAVYGRQFNSVVPAQIGFSRGADGIIVRSEIKRVNDLKGKVLITAQFTEADFFLRYLAQEAGLGINMLDDLSSPHDSDKVNLVFAADAFEAGDLFLEDLLSGRNRLAGCVTWAPKTTEVVADSNGAARLLASNKNLLIIADILVVNKGFAEENPALVAGLVDGLLEGNRAVRSNPDAALPVIARAFGWSPDETRAELAKVHLSNLPENLAFFAGTMDSAGSFNGIFQSAVYAYGKSLIPNPADPERFVRLAGLEALAASGQFAAEKIEIAPIRSGSAGPIEEDPLLSKDIRFFFEPNSAKLEMANQENLKRLDDIKRLLQVAPGSTILLRGHVDNALVPQFRQQGGEAFVRQMALQAMELSRNRAAEIKRALVERTKLAGDRVETVGRGWEEPASENSDENRRVEVQWFTIE
jgi:NitT/TauT family transport system substrate-binding protein